MFNNLPNRFGLARFSSQNYQKKYQMINNKVEDKSHLSNQIVV